MLVVAVEAEEPQVELVDQAVVELVVDHLLQPHIPQRLMVQIIQVVEEEV